MLLATAINCIDGRAQLPVIQYFKQKFNVDYVDNITEAGPTGILARNDNAYITESIMTRVETSVHRNGSQVVGVAGHHDCVGNPVSKEQQFDEIKAAVKIVKERLQNVTVVGLWIDEQWNVVELS